MDKKQMQRVVGVGVVALLVGFGAGNMYGKYHSNRVQFSGARGGNAGPGMMQGRAGMGSRGAGALFGEITAKDDKSVTLKLRDGGSKIVFFSESTVVSQSTTITPSDIAVGNTVLVDGTPNSDGSITAKSMNLNGFRMMGRLPLAEVTNTPEVNK